MLNISINVSVRMHYLQLICSICCLMYLLYDSRCPRSTYMFYVMLNVLVVWYMHGVLDLLKVYVIKMLHSLLNVLIYAHDQ